MWRRRMALLLTVAAAACGKTEGSRDTVGSSAVSVTQDPSDAMAVSGEWPAELGSALVIPSDTENLAVVVYPAMPTATLDPKVQFTLMTSGGEPVRVRVGVSGPDSARCGDATMVRLTHATPLVWSLGIAGAGVLVLRSDSLDALSRTDSLAYSVDAARLASSVSASMPSRLTGLPFALTALRRMIVGDTTIIAAQLVRRVNQEANPVEERTFVVAERGARSAFVTVHGDRSEGTEETASHFDLVGAFRAGSTIYLVLSTDAPSGSTIQILERSRGAWRVRWTRSIAC